MEDCIVTIRKSLDTRKKDFYDTILLKSENELHNLTEKINEDISTRIKNISKDIKDSISNKSSDISYMKLYFARTYVHTRRAIDAIKAFKESEDLIEIITNYLSKIKVKIFCTNLENIISNVQILKVIENKVGPQTINSFKWADGFSDLLEHIKESEKWYFYLNELHETLLKSEIQENIEPYVTLKKNIQINIENEKEELIKKSLEEFCFQVVNDSHSNVFKYEEIKHIDLNEQRLKSLNKILDLTIKPPTFQCLEIKDGLKLVGKGRYIKMSEIANKSCSHQPKIIEIFALDKVIIDATLNKTGDKVHLFIISPTWDIRGSPKIILDGKSGIIHEEVKANNAVLLGENGEDGKPGNPGGSAGHFFGIGEIFINSENLEIFANGGKGGPGQNGGDGTRGRDSTDPVIPKKGVYCSCSQYKDVYKFPCRQINEKAIGKNPKFGPIFIPFIVYTFELVGKPPETQAAGGNGGQGGSSGVGGYAGNITFIQFSPSKIKLHNRNGESGKQGVGGFGQVGGKLPISTTVLCKTTDCKWIIQNSSQNQRYQNGIKGKDGYNNKSLTSPERVEIFNPSISISQYKTYLRTNLSNSNSSKRWRLETFLNKLETDTKINNFYDTLGLVEDFRGTEELYYQFDNNSKLSILPLYKSLLQKINEYGNKQTMFEEDKKILGYLLLATLSKICKINNNLEDNLVLNLEDYLKFVLKNIDELEEYKSEHLNDEYQKKLQDKINSRIKIAETYVEAQITPEIDKIIYKIETQIGKLIEETIALQEKGKKKRDQLIQKEKELERALNIRESLSILKFSSMILSFVGPLGAAAGTVTAVAEYAWETSNTDSTDSISVLPPAIKDSVTKIENYYNEKYTNKVNLLNEQIKDINLEFEKISKKMTTEDLAQIKKQTEYTSTKLNQLLISQGEMPDFENEKTVESLRQRMTETLEKQKLSLEDKETDKIEKRKEKEQFVKYAKNLMSLSELGIDAYNKIRNDRSKVEKMNDAITNVENEIKAMIQREQEIYNSLIPIYKNLKTATKETNLKNESYEVLKFIEWKLKNTIEDFKTEILKKSKGFEVHDDLERSIERLESSITLMIDLYSRVDYYHNKTELYNFLKIFTSNKLEKTGIKNAEKKKAILELELTLRKNLLLEKYKIAMNAIKQYVFPFANHYLIDLEKNLPNFLHSADDIDNLKSRAKNDITKFLGKLTEAKSTDIKSHRKIVTNIRFDYSESYTKPFFEWKYKANRYEILKLLKGEEITVLADIAQGVKNKDAVKFKEIKINFILRNKRKQKKFQEKLNNFKLLMTHLGDNYYKCGDKIYLILNGSYDFDMFFSNSSGVYVDTKKVSDNEAVFSPYATWKIKLIQLDTDYNFELLKDYRNEPLDLHLVGKGQYMEEGSNVCNDNLHLYYTLVGNVSEITNINLDNKTVLQNSFIKNNNLGNDGHRHRRSLNKNYLNSDIKENPLKTIEVDSNTKSSFIKDMFYLIKNNFVATENSNFLNQITNWIKRNKSSVYQLVPKKTQIHNSMNMKSFHTQSLNIEQSELPGISNSCENNSTFHSMNNAVNTSLIYNTSNLLLLDLLFRQKTGIKYNQKDIIKFSNDSHLEFAQKLAYQKHLQECENQFPKSNKNNL